MDLLAGLHQPKAHFPRCLILCRILRVSDGREHEVRANGDVSILKYLLRLLPRKFDIPFYITPEGRTDVHQLGSVLGMFLENLQILFYHLAEMLIVCRGWLINVPFRTAIIYPNVRDKPIPEIGCKW